MNLKFFTLVSIFVSIDGYGQFYSNSYSNVQNNYDPTAQNHFIQPSSSITSTGSIGNSNSYHHYNRQNLYNNNNDQTDESGVSIIPVVRVLGFVKVQKQTIQEIVNPLTNIAGNIPNQVAQSVKLDSRYGQNHQHQHQQFQGQNNGVSNHQYQSQSQSQGTGNRRTQQQHQYQGSSNQMNHQTQSQSTGGDYNKNHQTEPPVRGNFNYQNSKTTKYPIDYNNRNEDDQMHTTPQYRPTTRITAKVQQTSRFYPTTTRFYQTPKTTHQYYPTTTTPKSRSTEKDFYQEKITTERIDDHADSMKVVDVIHFPSDQKELVIVEEHQPAFANFDVELTTRTPLNRRKNRSRQQ